MTSGICAIVVAAAATPLFQPFAAAAVAFTYALFAIREHNALCAATAPESQIGGSTARGLALIWAWGAVGIFFTYAVVLPHSWPEWWHFVLGFSLAAGASLVFAAMLDRDAQSGRTDASLMKIGRALVVLQLVGVIAGIVSMVADGKYPRAATHADWAACNIFFSGALSVAAISINALRKIETQ